MTTREPLTLTLPYPPSANTYWRFVPPRVLLSKKGRAYRKRVAQECIAAGVRKPFHGPLEVTIDAQPPDRRRRDLDNLHKAVWDALNHSGCYADDSQIKRCIAHMGNPMPGGQVRITVRPYRIIEPESQAEPEPKTEPESEPRPLPAGADDLPRGIRNSNPGNLRRTSDQWKGLAKEQPDPEFFTFNLAEYGIRALAKVLLTYQERHGLNTIREIIQRWAPPSENNTEAYIRSVAEQTAFFDDEPLDLRDADTMLSLVEAIITHENGMQPYSLDQMERGLSLAGIEGLA